MIVLCFLSLTVFAQKANLIAESFIKGFPKFWKSVEYDAAKKDYFVLEGPCENPGFLSFKLGKGQKWEVAWSDSHVSADTAPITEIKQTSAGFEIKLNQFGEARTLILQWKDRKQKVISAEFPGHLHFIVAKYFVPEEDYSKVRRVNSKRLPDPKSGCD